MIPELVETHRVIAPDLPAHGSTAAPDDGLDADRVLAWLGELIDHTCASPPRLVGHALGGAVGARFAIEEGDRLSRLVLVDSLGLARFRPSPRFALGLVGFVARPSERSYERFMRQCAFDLDALRERIGEDWEPFAYYNLELARAPSAKAAGKLLRKLGTPRIPPENLARISVPTSLIWGRHDRANRPRIAEAASNRYGWPLHVIEEAADDPPRDRPEAFLRPCTSRSAEPRWRRTGELQRGLCDDVSPWEAAESGRPLVRGDRLKGTQLGRLSLSACPRASRRPQPWRTNWTTSRSAGVTLLLLGKGAVLARWLVRRLAAELDD